MKSKDRIHKVFPLNVPGLDSHRYKKKKKKKKKPFKYCSIKKKHYFIYGT